MGSLLTYQMQESIATVTMDDGKVNVLSLGMQSELNRALDQAVTDQAVGAGFLDRVVSASELQDVAQGTAAALTKLDMAAHAASKLRARDHALKAIRAAIEAENAAFLART